MKNARRLTLWLVVILLLSATLVSAAPPVKEAKEEDDPYKLLAQLQATIEQQYQGGKLSEERRDELVGRISAKVAELQAFDAMTTEEQKSKLKGDFQAMVDAAVARGAVSREKADRFIGRFNGKVEAWDGNGYPAVMLKEIKAFVQRVRMQRHPIEKLKQAGK